MMEPIEFQPSEPFTLGVELELQLLDPQTCNLAPFGPELLEKVDPALQQQIKAEFIRSMVEVCTIICRDMEEVAENLLFLCATTEKLSRQSGCTLFASSLHPFAMICDRQISPAKRYHEIMDELQLSGRRMMTQALHVHVGMTDRESTIRVCDDIRQYLPILLALTTSSPYLETEDTGFYSYRSNLFCCLPRTGIPERLQSWEKFKEMILILNQATLLNGIKELWWDVRPHPDFGTIEIRICDLPAKMSHILAMVALIQALVATLTARRAPNCPSREIIIHNKWHAARYGLSGTFINHSPGTHKSFREAASHLLDFVMPKAKSLGSDSFLSGIRDIIQNGSSAHRQKELYTRYNDFRPVIETLQKEFRQ